MRLELEQSSKVIGEYLIYRRACYSTQIKDICLERTAEDSLMFTNQMRIRSELDNKVQQELSANSLQHLQLAVDSTANGILFNMCKMKQKSIYKSFQSFGKIRFS